MIRLIVQADDLGMCHAVNVGILRAFREGIVTQASAMAPCPWIGEAMQMILRHQIPVGVHCTLTCEWENLRWGPVTSGESLRAPDGGLWRTVEEARQHASPDEACAELSAQANRFLAAGIEFSYFDMHMGPASTSAFEHVCAQFGRPFLDPVAEPHVAFDSMAYVSEMDSKDKRGWMLAYIDALTPGLHFLGSHPGEASEELRAVTPPDSFNSFWAEETRISDLDVLCLPEVRRAIDTRGVELITAADL